MKTNKLNLLNAFNRKAADKQVKLEALVQEAMYSEMISAIVNGDMIKEVELPLLNDNGELLNVQARLGVETSSAQDQTGPITEKGRRGENMNSLEALNKLGNSKLFGSKTIKGFRYGVVKENVLEDGTVEEQIVSPLASKMEFVMSCRNRYVIRVFLASKQLSKELVELITKLDKSALEDIDCALLAKDISVFVRAAQEIAIDMTKDKSLTQIIELGDLLETGIFLASQKMKNDKNQTNLTSNARQAAKTRVNNDTFTYTFETPMADYKTSGEIQDAENGICKAGRAVKEAQDLVVDTNYLVQEKLTVGYIKEVAGPIVNMINAQTGANLLATEVVSRIKQDAQEVKELAFNMNPAIEATRRKSFSLDSASDEYGDNIKLMSDDLRCTLKRWELASPEVFNALSDKYAHIVDKKERFLNIACECSKIKVAAEMAMPNKKDFDADRYRGITRRFATPEYLLTEGLVNNISNDILTKDFTVKAIKAYNVEEGTPEQRVSIEEERFIVSEAGERLGQVIHARVKGTSKYTLRLNDELEYEVVESEDIVSMIKKDTGNRFIVVTELPETVELYDEEFKIEDLVIVPGLEQDEIDKRLSMQEALCDSILATETMDYEPAINLISLGENDLELAPKTDYRYVLGLNYNILTVLNKLTLTHSLNQVIDAMEAQVEKTCVVSYTLEDAYISGTKLALVVSEM